MGDGLDMRRPVMAGDPRAVIDLTQDESMPPPAYRSLSPLGPRYSSDRANQSEQPSISGTMERPLIVDSDDSSEPETPPVIDVDNLDIYPTPITNADINHVIQPRIIARVDQRGQYHGPLSLSRNLPPLPTAPSLGSRQLNWTDELRRRRSIAADMIRNMRIPGLGSAGPIMDYEAVAFDLNGDTGPSAAAEPPVPTYDAPSPPRKGFSRNPGEDEVAVCPKCDEELGVGENEIKRQVWVVKNCGHVGFHSHLQLRLFLFLSKRLCRGRALWLILSLVPRSTAANAVKSNRG